MLTCISKNEKMTIENINFNQIMSKYYSFNALLLINIVHQSLDKIITLCLKVIKSPPQKTNKQTKTRQPRDKAVDCIALHCNVNNCETLDDSSCLKCNNYLYN